MKTRGEVASKILETISEIALNTFDVVEVILSSPYGTSQSKFEYNLRQIRRNRERRKHKEGDTQRLYNFLYRLRRDGLIIQTKNRWRLTKLGAQTLKIIRNPLRRKQHPYKKTPATTLIIVAFDIPEKERRKRTWIRSVLWHLGFTLLQKSLWIGKTKLPDDFIRDLHDLGIIRFVEIFEITKTGIITHH